MHNKQPGANHSSSLHLSFSKLFILQMNSGGGMPMGYGGYPSQPMDHQGAYGGASYGAMGMMGANSFQSGMPMG